MRHCKTAVKQPNSAPVTQENGTSIQGNRMSSLQPLRWRPNRTTQRPAWPQPPLGLALLRGFMDRCPACGRTRLFRGFLKVQPVCANCTAPLGQYRSDDLPPYFTIFIVGHIVVPLMLVTERQWSPPLWVHAAIFLPLTLILTLLLLRPVKGAVVGLMLRLGLEREGTEPGAPHD
jgi:uncharacterized protein (DUF983 family)